MMRYFKTNGYKHFFYKVLLLIVFVLILDSLIGYSCRFMYSRSKYGTNHLATHVMERTEAEILIFGSSRANHHYQPGPFHDRLKMSYYNAGRDGNFILYHYAVLKSVLKRYSPKIIILDIAPQDFYLDQTSYDRLSNLLPYYKTHPEIREIINLKSPYEKIKLMSKIYPYNSSIVSLITQSTDIHNKEKLEAELLGYKPLMEIWVDPIEKESENELIDEKKIEYFKAFIDDCKKAEVKLYVFVSPIHKTFDTERKFIQVAQKITKQNEIPFVDFSQDELFLTNKIYFADDIHLNDIGAKVFTERAIDIIRNIIDYQQ